MMMAGDGDNNRHTTATQLGPNAIAPPAGATAEDEGDLVFHDLPPFPDDVPTAPLLRLSLTKLLDRDPEEIDRLWKASCDIGFFYLDLRHALTPISDAAAAAVRNDSGTDLPSSMVDESKDGQINGDGLLADAEALFGLGEKVFALSESEKQEYDFADRGSYFGYKGLGKGVIDSKGTRDGNEFYNISKDDIFGLGERLPAPDVLQDESHRALLGRYMQRSHAIVSLLFTLLNDHLALPPETLPGLHRLRGVSGDQVRWVRSPPPTRAMDERTAALGEHTDFGSLTILFNRLGGLQVLPPGEGQQWCYVRPLRGHAVCNLGDAMVKFTAGLLRSNIHRVVAAPGEQAMLPRMSLVYFARPEDPVVLAPLEESSEVIAAERRKHVRIAGDPDDQVTAKEWVLRRAMGMRNRADYEASRGTEGWRTK